MTEMKVNLPANPIWDVYRSKDFGYLLLRLMPDYLKQVIYENGDGRVGTVFNTTLQPGLFVCHFLRSNVCNSACCMDAYVSFTLWSQLMEA